MSASGSGALPPDVAAALAKGEKEGQAVVLWTVGMFCIFGWDWIINFYNEVERVWRRKFTYISALYIANRYYGLIQFAIVILLITTPITQALDTTQCRRIYLWQPVGAVLTTLISQTIMGCRVFALYAKNKWILVVLGTWAAIEFAIFVKTLTVVFPAPAPGPGVLIPCVAVGPTNWLVTFWTMPLVYDTLTFLLTLGKSVSLWRKDIQSRTLSAFFQDGLIYFIVIFLMNIINVVLFVTQDSTLQAVNLPATLMMNILMTCRLILNVRAPQTSYTFGQYAPGGSSGHGSSRAPLYAGMGDEQASHLPAYKMATFGGTDSQLESGNGARHQAYAHHHPAVPVVITKTTRTTSEDKGESASMGHQGVMDIGHEKPSTWW